MIIDKEDAEKMGLKVLKSTEGSMSVKEVSELTGKNKTQIHLAVRLGELNAGIIEGINGKRIIKDAKLDYYLANNKKS